MAEGCRNFVLSCLCCNSLPTCKGIPRSTCTKTIYTVIFFSNFTLMLLANNLSSITKNLPFCKGDKTIMCKNFSNFFAVYRVSLAYVLFYVIMCICTFGITSSRSYRSGLHNGFWLLKFTFIVGLLVINLYIPYGLFDTIFMYFGLIFVITFNIFEMFLFMHVVKMLASFFITYCWRRASAFTKFFVTFFTLLLLAAGSGIFIVLFLAYTNCTFNFIFILVNMTVSHLINFGSLFIKLQRRDWSSFLGGSILTTHVMFLTWSAVANNPRPHCFPAKEYATPFFLINNFIGMSVALLTVVLAAEYFIRTVTKEKPNAVIYVEKRGKECCGLWGRRKFVEIIQPLDSSSPPEGVLYRSTDLKDDEYDQTKYFWYAMHNLFLQATFYFMICFTSSYKYQEHPTEHVYVNEAAMWFKIVSSWLCMLSFALMEFLPDSTRIYLSNRSS